MLTIIIIHMIMNIHTTTVMTMQRALRRQLDKDNMHYGMYVAGTQCLASLTCKAGWCRLRCECWIKNNRIASLATAKHLPQQQERSWREPRIQSCPAKPHNYRPTQLPEDKVHVLCD